MYRWATRLTAFLMVVSCKHAGGAQTLAATPLGPNNEVDLTTYTGDGSECQTSTANEELETNDRFTQAILALPNYKDPTLPYHAIPVAELLAIRRYSLADYVAENNALRFQDLLRLKQQAGAIKCTASGLNKMPAYIGTVTRSATLRDSDLAPYKPNQVMIMQTFVSATKADIDMEGSLALAHFCGNIKYIIQSSGGRDISWLSNVPEEQEVLFTPGSEFLTVSVVKQPSPWQTTDILRGKCATKFPVRTLITLTQVPSGTYQAEHPNEVINAQPGPFTNNDDVIKALRAPGINKALADKIIRSYFEQTVAAATTGDLLEKALVMLKNLCLSDQTLTAYFQGESHAPECHVKTVALFAGITFRKLQLAENSSISFYPSGQIEQALLAQPATIDGFSAREEVTYYENGKLHTFFDSTGAITIYGQRVKPSLYNNITLDEQGNPTSMCLGPGSPPYVYAGKSYQDCLRFAADGSVTRAL